MSSHQLGFVFIYTFCVFYNKFVIKKSSLCDFQIKYADIIFIYGFSNANSRAAKREYEQRFPNLRLCIIIFSFDFNSLQNNGFFPKVVCSIQHPVEQQVPSHKKKSFK